MKKPKHVAVSRSIAEYYDEHKRYDNSTVRDADGEYRMRVAIYCRVSTSEQTTENQIIALTRHARKMNWRYFVYEETMTTRKTRPVKQDVLAALRARQYDAVMIWKLDRWARSTRELILEIEELHGKGLKFISLTDNIDLSTPTGKLQFQIMSAFAEFERNLIRERTLEGLARAKMKGRVPGRPAGSKDKKKRRKAGYLMHHANERKKVDVENGIHYDIDEYVNKNASK